MGIDIALPLTFMCTSDTMSVALWWLWMAALKSVCSYSQKVIPGSVHGASIYDPILSWYWHDLICYGRSIRNQIYLHPVLDRKAVRWFQSSIHGRSLNSEICWMRNHCHVSNSCFLSKKAACNIPSSQCRNCFQQKWFTIRDSQRWTTLT